MVAAAPKFVSAEAVFDNGPPDRAHGSAITHWIQAEDVALSTGARIESIRFWSFEFSGGFTGRIYWQIYANGVNNSPGNLLHTGTAVNLVHSATGFALGGSIKEFVSTFQIDPVSLRPGIYWLALHNGPPSSDPGQNQDGFFWEASTDVVAAPSHGREAPYTNPWFSNAFPGYPPGLAFELHGVPGPALKSWTISDGQPRLSFTTVAGRVYRVEYTEDLSAPAWTPVRGAEMIAGNGEVVEVRDNDVDTRSVPRRCYRVRLL